MNIYVICLTVYVVNLYVLIKISGFITLNSKYWINAIEWTSEWIIYQWHS